jgi:predicted transcriptional regulator
MNRTVTRLRRMDNNKFENIFAADKDAIKYQDMKLSTIRFEDIEPFLNKLPPREIDLLTLYRKFGKNQKDIARMFSVTQGAVSSRLKRALDRLKFLRDLPKITEEEIDQALGNIFDPMEVEIIKCMKETTCQSRTAEIINQRFCLTDEKHRMTQVKVRHRFEKCLLRLAALQNGCQEYVRFYNLLLIIKNNLYMLHEVKLPHFDRGTHAIFSLNS